MPHFLKSVIQIYILLYWMCGLLAQSSDNNSLRFKVANALRTETAPVIDGILEPLLWKKAPNIDQFVQTEPVELGKASEETSSQILYDDKHIYVAITCRDSEPEEIKRVLSRRDSYENGFGSNSDWVRVGFDSKNNDQSATLFGVNAAGVKIDVAVEGHQNYDVSWNSVWDVAVSSDSKGWYAEYKIPFSIFQFDNKPDMEWGLLIGRHLYKAQEFIEWPGRRISDQGTARFFGILKGLKDIPDPKQFEITPYTLLGSNAGDFKSNIGADIRYGISSNLIAQITFNPDFGQVESDPSVLNLSAFETELEERRPFFSEGAKFFDNRVQLFNSRRIGKTPSFSYPEEGELSDLPENTTILGALKLMGNLSNGVNYGLINALASEEKGTWKSDADSLIIQDSIIEPQTNYSVGRLEVPLINDVSRVGIMGTNVSRKNASGATVMGFDWKLGFLNNRLYSNGQIMHSNKDQILGNAHRFNLMYTDPSFWGIRTWYGYLDDKFDINDLGFLRRNNMSWMGAKIILRKDDPWGKFLNNNFEIRISKNYRNDGTLLENEIGLESNNLLKSYWSFGFFGMLSGSAFEDQDLFRDDRAWIYETEQFGYFGPKISTDRRKKLILGFNGGVGYAKLRGPGYRFSANSIYKPKDNLNIRINFTQDLSPSRMQWVDIIGDDINISRVYARTEQWTRKIDFRVDWTLSPDISFQGFFQPFRADMKYEDFFYLVEPNTMELDTYPYLEESNGDPGFKIENSIGTFVLRWEYSPGSTLFLVYNLNENKYYENSTGSWDKSSANAIYLKLSYWFKN